MLSAGLRVVLAAAVPLGGAAVVHELRRSRVAMVGVALLSIAGCAALTLTVASAVAGGGVVERGFGTAIPGVDLTARADSASVAAILLGCLAALLAVPRHRHDPERLAGLLLCLTGAVAVAAAGNLVLASGGVEVIAAGALLLRGRRGPGARSAVLLALLLGGGGLALTAAAALLVAVAGSSDLAFVPAGAVGEAVAVAWALGGAAMVLSPALPGAGASPVRDWAAVGALPAGFLVLLRLQETVDGQLPPAAAVVLSVVGAAVACVAAYTALRSTTLAAAGRSCVAVLAGVLVSLFAGPLPTAGTLLAGLFLAIEVALLAAPAWGRRPSSWSVLSLAVTALPGGAALTVVAAGLGTVAHAGAAAFPQLLVLVGVVATAAVAGARSLAAAPAAWRPVAPGAVIAIAAGVAGGVLPGLAMRLVAAPLSGGAAAADLDAGTLGVPGGGFAGGYFTIAAGVLVTAVSAALVVAGEERRGLPVGVTTARRVPPALPLLRLRRLTRPATRRAATALSQVDRWLETQPHVSLLVGAAVAAVLLLR